MYNLMLKKICDTVFSVVVVKNAKNEKKNFSVLLTINLNKFFFVGGVLFT